MNVTHNTMRQSECAMICRYVATLLFNDQLNQSENSIIHHVHVVGGNALAHECTPIQILNLLGAKKLDIVYDKVRAILTRFGTIDDEAKKLFGPILVLNYGKGERMLKVEISIREYPNHYEMRSLAGTDIRVMTMPDMFAHKLCAMGERLSPRDIFDVWFFLQNHTEINEEIVQLRTGKSVAEYAAWCAEHVREASPKLLMQGLGEVLNDAKSKTFVKNKLIDETSSALELFSAFPIIYKE